MLIRFKGKREKAHLVAEPKRIFMESVAFELGLELWGWLCKNEAVWCGLR